MSLDPEIERELEIRVRPGGHQLFLRASDVTVAHLSRIFKIKAETLFLEEDVTDHIELPSNAGNFNLGQAPGKYKVCGEPITQVHHDQENSAPPEPRPSFRRAPPSAMDWGQPRPWQTSSNRGDLGGPSNPLSMSNKKPKYESQWKRTIPLVALCADQSGKKMCVDTIISNVYVKIPEAQVSVQAILSEVAPKVDVTTVDELVLLDATLVPLPDERRDIEYWRPPSRKFYIARVAEYEELKRTVNRKRLSLRKRPRNEFPEGEMFETEQMERMESNIQKVTDEMVVIKQHSARILGLLHLIDCKICKNVPTDAVLVTCCSQIFGCRGCFEQTIQHNPHCPLCRASSPQCIPVRGYEPLFEYLRDAAPAQ